MTAVHLRACTACSRHVRVSELACPFCGGVLDDAFRATPAPVPLTVRLSRAAIFAIGTGTLSLAAACGGATTSAPLPPGDAGEGITGVTEGSDSGNEGYDGSNFAVPYGLPPPPPVDAGAGPPPFDADVPDSPTIAPPYGVPPPPPMK